MPFLPLAYAAGRWGSPKQVQQWVEIVGELALRGQDMGGNSQLYELAALPATLAMYSFCLGAVVAKQPDLMGHLAWSMFENRRRGPTAAGIALNIACLLSTGYENFKSLPRYSNKKYPGSEMVADILRPVSAIDLRTAEAFGLAFAKVELALSFGFSERRGKDGQLRWRPPALADYELSLREKILDEWRRDYLTIKIFQPSP